MEHYYGDIVRRLFVAGAIIMIGSLPFFLDQIHEPLTISMTAILIVSVAAGLTSPRYILTALLDVVVSAAAVIMFEWYALHTYRTEGGVTAFFVLNQALAVLFLVALYYAVKTLRTIKSVSKKAASTEQGNKKPPSDSVSY